MQTRLRFPAIPLVILILSGPATVSASGDSAPARAWFRGAYLDAGYTADFNDPENRTWRSKSTSYEVNDPRINMAMAYVRRDATLDTRWGLEFGLQAGVDTKLLAPPGDDDPVTNAEELKYLRAANASWMLGVGNGLRMTGGLFGAYIGYESIDAINNHNYTRGYLSDLGPYFLAGLQAAYPILDNLDLSLYAVTGYSYLQNLNNAPSYGAQVAWDVTAELSFTQNVYYGPDQADTDLQYWRFFSDTIVEWSRGPYVVAGELCAGTEKQAETPGTPRFNWVGGALWVRWNTTPRWSVAFRPEFYRDTDGLISGAAQTIQAYTTTVKYGFFADGPWRLVASAEYRYDRSTGAEGGFYKGPDNGLVPDTNLLILAVTGAVDW
jgi:hypothetical protein